MSDAERRESARQFFYKWQNKGQEKKDDQSYWLDFLQDVLGVERATDRIEFQKDIVKPDGKPGWIDAYIPETHVLIEQKSLGIPLDKPQQWHDGMTPYEQAKMYDNCLPHSEKARWILVSNFAEIWIYDLEERRPEPKKFLLSDIQAKYSLFEFLVNKKQQKISQEMKVSIDAGRFVGLIYEALYKQYIDPDNVESLKSLNMLCVRLVFCLYAEDAHIFGTNGHMFHDYMDQFETKDMRKALIELFRILDTPENERDPYDDSPLSQFPYVNGGLFAREDIEIPRFTDEIRDILLNKASEGFDWSDISPTIFGAVFESTLNPDTRRSGGMHYTSIENIHKVIDPLFLDDLKAELNEIKAIQVEKTRNAKLMAFQDKLASLSWLDPACGSGNFLTETYISIRRLENEVIKELKGGQIFFTTFENSPIKVSIDQFYGIEINDFAVTVAKTALWIAESQMMKETEDILLMQLDFLPLKTNAHIVEGNAIRMDWDNVCPRSKLKYIMGNPPFIGHQWRGQEQVDDMAIAFHDLSKHGKLDYVTAWYNKSIDYMKGENSVAAFVSTNSIVQGESVGILWDFLFKKGLEIQFAYRSFSWSSESTESATVHCVIIGFTADKSNNKKILIDGEKKDYVDHINGYLISAPNVFIQSRGKPRTEGMPEMSKGSQPTDGGYLLLNVKERQEIINQYPDAEKLIKRYISADDYINNRYRYCLWLKDVPPSEYRGIKPIMERLEKVAESRKNSPTASVRKDANKPMLFTQIRQPTTEYLAVPEVSSEKRRYIPIGYLTPDVIGSNKLYMIPNASLFMFGILISNVHMAWMRIVAGRLELRYSYSPAVYNNFPWPSPTDDQKLKIENTAQGILSARALYPNSSLADLYDPLTMPPELQKAHTANDRAVMNAYGFDIKNMSEADCVAALMKMYQEMTK